MLDSVDDAELLARYVRNPAGHLTCRRTVTVLPLGTRLMPPKGPVELVRWFIRENRPLVQQGSTWQYLSKTVGRILKQPKLLAEMVATRDVRIAHPSCSCGTAEFVLVHCAGGSFATLFKCQRKGVPNFGQGRGQRNGDGDIPTSHRKNPRRQSRAGGIPKSSRTSAARLEPSTA